jgi:transposase
LRENVGTLLLLKLPPYAPELNPIEHVWDELREKYFHNRVFDSLDALELHLMKALRELESDSSRLCSIVAWSWIMEAIIVSFMN